MYTIVLASQKGGSGKTTLSGHLAVQAELAGAGPVAIIDTDPQGSLAAWWNTRKAERPHFVQAGLPDLGKALEDLKSSGFNLVVIDTPPAITSSISQVMAHADLVIVPARPSPHDLRAVGATVDIAERHAKPVMFVLNAATARARITGEAAVALSQHGTVAPVTVKNRVDFAASMVDGRTVSEAVPDGASAAEMRDLWAYVQDKLFRMTRDPSIMPDARPNHLSVTPLSALDDAPADEIVEPEQVADEEPPIPEPSAPSAFAERRAPNGVSFGSAERRHSAFGRRVTDRFILVQGSSK
jgi:chromosome partitioning protein